VSRYPFAFAPSYKIPGLLFGVTPRTAWVEVDDDRLSVRFGPWSLRTPLANVTDVTVTRDYAFLKTAGPPHLSFADRGVTFATNGDAGVCVSFATPVRGIDPTGRITHPGATLTVADVEGLRRRLART
jgi:hypothetical protein